MKGFFLNEIWPALFLLWIIHCISVLIFSLPSFLYIKKKIEFHINELFLVFIPYFTWASLWAIDSSSKGYGNFYEGVLLGIFIALYPLFRFFIPHKQYKVMLLSYLIISILIGFCLWAYMPRIDFAQ